MAIGELHAFHPGLTIVFAGTRKLANEMDDQVLFSLKRS